MADQVSTDAAKAKKVSVDGETIERQDLDKQVAAQRHTDANTEAKKPHRGLGFAQFRNRGTQ